MAEVAGSQLGVVDIRQVAVVENHRAVGSRDRTPSEVEEACSHLVVAGLDIVVMVDRNREREQELRLLAHRDHIPWGPVENKAVGPAVDNMAAGALAEHILVALVVGHNTDRTPLEVGVEVEIHFLVVASVVSLCLPAPLDRIVDLDCLTSRVL